MSLPRSVAVMLREHVTLEVESMDRMYLNVYVPQLQHERGVAAFFRYHRGHPFASSALMDPISKAFIRAIEAFAVQEQVPLVSFAPKQRKDDVMAVHLARFTAREGVVFIGKAPGEDPRLPHGEADQPRHRPAVPLDRPGHRHGQPLLRLRCGPRLRPLLPEVLFVLPLHRQALPERARVREAAAHPAGDRLRSLGQRHPLVCRSAPPAGAVRWPVRREDRRAPPEVAPPPAAPVHRSRPPGGLPLRLLDPPGGVQPHAGVGPAAHGAGLLRGGHPGEPRPGGGPTRCS